MMCPHCLGSGCLHCREAAAGRPPCGHSLLTPADRRALLLMPLRGLRFAIPGVPPPRPRVFGSAVLPRSFTLPEKQTFGK